MRLFITVLLSFFILTSFAANHYFSLAGDDNTGNGTIGSPWKTTTKFNSVFASFAPGDSVLFRRGDVFPGSLNISRAGASGSPIVIGAYGTGAKPVITALSQVTAWTSLGGGIYESTGAVSTLGTLMTVTVNGVMTAWGRYPKEDATNKGYLTYSSGSGGVLTSSQLSGVTSFVGGELVVRLNRWSIDRCKITGQSSTTVSYTQLSEVGRTDHNPTGGMGFFFANHPATLTQAGTKVGEWYYDPNTKKIRMYFGSNSPSSYVVKVSTAENIVTAANRSYVTLSNLSLQGGNTYGAYITTGTNNIIKNCDVLYSGNGGIVAASTSGFVADGNYVDWNWSQGINGMTNTTGVTITNNIVKHVSYNPAMLYKKSADGLSNGIAIGTSNSLVQYNEVVGAGYMGIRMHLFSGANNMRVLNNFVDSCTGVKDDAGSIYTYSNAGLTHSGNKVMYNIVDHTLGAQEGTGKSDKQGHALYSDFTSDNTEWAYNTAMNTSQRAMYLNDNRSLYIHDNTFYNSTWGIRINQGTNSTGSTMSRISNNIMFALNAGDYAANYKSFTQSNYTTIATLDSNTYCRPIAPTTYIHGESGAGTVNQTLAQWKSATGQDAHSTASPVTITNVSQSHIYYNATKDPVTITIPSGTVDIYGTSISGSQTLDPYTSLIGLQTGAVSVNALSFSPTALSFSTVQNGSPANQSATLSSNNGTPTVILSSSASWVVLPTAAVGSLSFGINTTGLAVGSYTATITAASGGYTSATMQINLTVSAANSPPVLASIGNKSAIVGQALTFTATATDVNVMQTKTFSLIGPPVGATIGSSSGAFAWIPSIAGTYTFGVMVADNGTPALSDTENITVTVAAANRAPVLDPIGDKPALTGQLLTFTATATELDAGQTKTYSLSGAPSGATIGTSSGVFNWTPSSAGTFTFTVIVTDNGTPALTDQETITVTVTTTPPNALSFSQTSLSYNVVQNGTPANQSSTLSSNSGTPTVTLTKSQSWVTLPTAALGSLSFGINTAGLTVGTYTATVTASAVGYTSATLNISLIITAPNTLLFSPSSLSYTVQEGSSVGSQTSVLSSNSGAPAVSLTRSQTWVVLPANGLGTLSFGINATGLTAGTYTATVTAAAVGYTSAVLTITLTVTAAPPPTNSIVRVDFYNGEELIGSDSTSPYSLSWPNVTAGTYIITAKGIDQNGAVGVSSPITVIVSPADASSGNFIIKIRGRKIIKKTN